jgi:hypothetical protein
MITYDVRLTTHNATVRHGLDMSPEGGLNINIYWLADHQLQSDLNFGFKGLKWFQTKPEFHMG